jgi:hypothetical protein
MRREEARDAVSLVCKTVRILKSLFKRPKKLEERKRGRRGILIREQWGWTV